MYKPLLFLACLSPLLLALVGALHAAQVAGAWLPHTSWTDLGADPARRLLGIFGKTTLNLLLITLAVTPLRQLSGNAHLLRLRRMLGVFAFSYALLHFATYIGPFSGFDWHNVGRDLYKRPYITIGFLALSMLVPLAVTSTRAMMRRLKRNWQRLHRLIYVIAMFGVWHYWWQVKKDVREPLIYAALLALLLLWRVMRRIRPAATSPSVPPTIPGKSAA